MVSISQVRNIVFSSGDSREPRSINLYFDHYEGKPIYRCVAYLSNSGCQWSRKTGGCTMCGTKNTSLKRQISDEDFFAQFALIRKYIEEFNSCIDQPIASLNIYNDGFFFNDDEISPTAREEIFKMAREYKMRKLVIETNGLDIVRDDREENYLQKAVNFLEDTRFEVTLGLESANPLVRRLYNKPDSFDTLKASLDIIRKKGAIAKGYVLIKGPMLTELEAYEDCVNTIRELKNWSNGEKFRVEFQPTCLLPDTLHEYLSRIKPDDPYFWEPPLLSTLFRILHNFPDMDEDLYTALFAKIESDSPWEFWQTRPHDDPETTYKLYLKLVEHYLYRKFDSITSALEMANEELWEERKKNRVEQSLEERVDLVQKLLECSREKNMSVCQFLNKYLPEPDDFFAECQKLIS